MKEEFITVIRASTISFFILCIFVYLLILKNVTIESLVIILIISNLFGYLELIVIKLKAYFDSIPSFRRIY